MNKNKVYNLPVFMHDLKTREILTEVASVIPKKSKVYIVGGAIRNAIFYKIFKKKITQRDYDLVIIDNKDKFIKNLRAIGFKYGFLRRKNEVTLKKKLILKPKDTFSDFVLLDIHFSKEKSIMKNLQDNTGFTINGFALSLKEINSKDWYEKIIALPKALEDLKNKKLRVNIIAHPAMLFACLRFMSKGFKRPSKKEIESLLKALGKLEKWRYKRNIKKLFDYVGGEKETRKLIKKTGVKKDIFDIRIIKKLR